MGYCICPNCGLRSDAPWNDCEHCGGKICPDGFMWSVVAPMTLGCMLLPLAFLALAVWAFRSLSG
jgi:hypothetical protein